jgi:acyl-CoA synthetase (NDP forming)
VFGPVVVFGLGGVAKMIGDDVARLAPLTDADADDLIEWIRAVPALRRATDPGALRDVLLRVSRLADDMPQVAELTLNPVIACRDRAIAVDARIRVTSPRLADPFLRQLPQ